MSWSGDKRCLYCGAKLPLYRKVLDEQFCSDAHRRSFRIDQDQLALRTLQDSHKLLTQEVPLTAKTTERPVAPESGAAVAPAHGRRSTHTGAVGLAGGDSDPSSKALFRQQMPQDEAPVSAPPGAMETRTGIDDNPLRDFSSVPCEALLELPAPQQGSSVAPIPNLIAPLQSGDFELAMPSELSSPIWVPDFSCLASAEADSRPLSLDIAFIEKPIPLAHVPAPFQQQRDLNLMPIQSHTSLELAAPQVCSAAGASARRVELAAHSLGRLLPGAMAPADVSLQMWLDQVAAVQSPDAFELAVPEPVWVIDRQASDGLGPDDPRRSGLDGQQAPSRLAGVVIAASHLNAAAPVAALTSSLLRGIRPLDREAAFELAVPEALSILNSGSAAGHFAALAAWVIAPVPASRGSAGFIQLDPLRLNPLWLDPRPEPAAARVELPKLPKTWPCQFGESWEQMAAYPVSASAGSRTLRQSGMNPLQSALRKPELPSPRCFPEHFFPAHCFPQQRPDAAALLSLKVNLAAVNLPVNTRGRILMDWSGSEAQLPTARLETEWSEREHSRVRGSLAFWTGQGRAGMNPLQVLDIAADFWKHAPRDFKLLAFVIPLALALVFHPGLPKVHVKAAPLPAFAGTAFAPSVNLKPVTPGVEGSGDEGSGEKGSIEKGSREGSGAETSPGTASQVANLPGTPPTWQDSLLSHFGELRKTVAARAGVELNEDFRSGMDDWQGRDNSVADWSFDANGFVRPASLALYHPSLMLRDYDMEFLGLIDKRALSFVARARDTANYYAVKLVVVKPGPLPVLGLVRYPVIDGRAGKAVETRLTLDVRNDTIYRVALSIHDDTYLLMIQGNVADSWSESRLTRGGIGFFADKGEENRLRWVQVSHQYDMLGRLCAYLAPYNPQTTNGSW